jgi:hypothetical protein
MIAEGDDLRSQWVRMKEFGEEVNATGYEYHPTSQNSNSFVAEALRRGGFFGPGTAFPEIRQFQRPRDQSADTISEPTDWCIAGSARTCRRMACAGER